MNKICPLCEGKGIEYTEMAHAEIRRMPFDVPCYEFTCGDIWFRVPVEYCPMCGRKLDEE